MVTLGKICSRGLTILSSSPSLIKSAIVVQNVSMRGPSYSKMQYVTCTTFAHINLTPLYNVLCKLHTLANSPLRNQFIRHISMKALRTLHSLR